MKNSHRIGGTELTVSRQNVAQSEVVSLEIDSKSSIDHAFIVVNMTLEEFKGLVSFLAGNTP